MGCLYQRGVAHALRLTPHVFGGQKMMVDVDAMRMRHDSCRACGAPSHGRLCARDAIKAACAADGNLGEADQARALCGASRPLASLFSETMS